MTREENLNSPYILISILISSGWVAYGLISFLEGYANEVGKNK
jgi:hypothetical protein